MYKHVHETTENVNKDVNLPAMSSVKALLELEELSVAEFDHSLKAGEIARRSFYDLKTK